MSDDSTSDRIPPVIGQPTGVGGSPNELPPFSGAINAVSVTELLLKSPQQIPYLARKTGARALLGWLAGVIIVCAAVYGVVVGAFSGGGQLWAAPAKLVIGIIASALFCLPGLYIAACLSGRDVKVNEVAVSLLAVVGLSSVLLIGFAPAAWLFSVSTNSIEFMGLLHLAVWAVGTSAGLRLLNLALGNGRSIFRGHLLLWCVMFILVCLQMTTTLRPLLGTTDRFLSTERKFFVVHWWDCAQGKSR